MTLWQIRLISVLCPFLTALVVPAYAGDPENKEIKDGYVKDGLHCEGNMNFTGAISAYKKAVSAQPEDRYAWLRLAKGFRARDQYGEALVNEYELRQKEQRTERRLFNVRPVVPSSYQYCPAQQFRSYRSKIKWQPLMQTDDDKRIIYVDPSIAAKIGREDSFPRLDDLAYFQAAYETAVARLKDIEAARYRKDLVWKDIETSNCDGAAMWLKLGLACESCRADEGEAALQIALLSNPSVFEAELARLALARIWASGVKSYDYTIAPVGH